MRIPFRSAYRRLSRGLEIAPTPWEKVKRAGKVLVREARVPTGRWRILPRFLIIGAQKAGTHSLYHYLCRHPDVARAFTKEPHYFDRHFARGTTWYRAHFPFELRRTLYERRHGRYFITGDATPDYLFHPHAPERVHRLLPEARLIVLLRNPVDRAISHYHHQRLRGIETLSFPQAVQAEAERLSGEAERVLADPGYYSYAFDNFSYLRRGLYAEQLARWFRVFRREQILVLESELLFRETRRIYREVLEFLSLTDSGLTTFPAHYTGSYATRASDDSGELREHFGGPNEELFELLGRRLSWD